MQLDVIPNDLQLRSMFLVDWKPAVAPPRQEALLTHTRKVVAARATKRPMRMADAVVYKARAEYLMDLAERMHDNA